MAATVIACSAQQASTSLPRVDPQSTLFQLKGINHRIQSAQGGAPYPLQGTQKWGSQCPADPPYCYGWEQGNSITLPLHIIGEQSNGNCGAPADLQTNTEPTPMTGLVETITPETYNPPPMCGYWAATVSMTLTETGNYLISVASNSAICCGSVDNTFYALEGFVYESYTHPPATPGPTPTPGVDILDFNLNEIVTNTTQSAVAGQEQLLQALPSQPGETVTKCNWTVSGNTVGGYVPNGSPPSAVTLSNLQQVKYFWIGSGTNNSSVSYGISVTCTASPGGKVSASSTYTVSQPTFSANSSTYSGAVTIYNKGYYNSGPGTYIANASGPSPSPTPGVVWNYKVNGGGAGQIGMQQLISYKNTAVQGGSKVVLSSTGGDYCDDSNLGPNAFPYVSPAAANVTWAAFDEPAQEVSAALSSAQISYEAQDYFMYEPANDNVGPSIWLTVAKATWNFKTGATDGVITNTYPLSNNLWTLNSPSASGTTLSSSSALPTWPTASPCPAGSTPLKGPRFYRKRLFRPRVKVAIHNA